MAPTIYVCERGNTDDGDWYAYVPATPADVTDGMVERARLAQGRLTLGGEYLTTQDPRLMDVALAYAIPLEEMRVAIEAVFSFGTFQKTDR